MNQPEGRATWADIPLEVMQQILDYCDYPSLLNLGRVNKDLNDLALRTYLGPDVIDGPNGCFPTPSKLYGWQPIRALCLAFWIPNPTVFTYYAYHRSYSHMVHEFRCITALIRRMSEPTLERLTLSVHNTCKLDPKIVGAKCHLEIWSELIEAAWLKGCKKLDISETSNIGVPPNEPPSHSVLSTLPKSLLLPGFPEFFYRPLPRARALGFEDLEMHVPSLIQPPLLSYTLQLLKRNAGSIEQLSLGSHPDRTKAADWEGFFSGLISIKLNRLKFVTFEDIRSLPAQTLYDFFALHTTLIEISWPFGMNVNVTEQYHPKRVLSLPYLQNLRAGPLAPIEWFFKNFQTPNLSHIRVPLLSLLTMPIRTSFKNIMLGLGSLRDVKVASRVVVEFGTPCDTRWMSEMEEALEDFERLHRSDVVLGYKKLELFGWISRSNAPQQSLIDILPRWLALFPFLEELTFSLCNEDLLEDLLRAIVERCLRLRRIESKSLACYTGVWDVRDGVCNAVDFHGGNCITV